MIHLYLFCFESKETGFELLHNHLKMLANTCVFGLKDVCHTQVKRARTPLGEGYSLGTTKTIGKFREHGLLRGYKIGHLTSIQRKLTFGVDSYTNQFS